MDNQNNKSKEKRSLLDLWQALYSKIFKINDSPEKIALGLGIGVFAGLTPTIGPLTAIFIAVILRANRASALLGVLLTNTWLSLLTFILSIKVGAALLGLQWENIYYDWVYFLKTFHLADLFKMSIIKIAIPVVIGYLIMALALGIITYFITLIILKLNRYLTQKKAGKNI
ncbi:MAG: DUF2062 domain-containing protein [Candidatus Omnitrophota bacterium]|jgi:uncharacterized protein (DUF2062 family)|nr:MAG: DUF2062 domain-containing protein [Candidatus Omnitrophota bacterium]